MRGSACHGPIRVNRPWHGQWWVLGASLLGNIALAAWLALPGPGVLRHAAPRAAANSALAESRPDRSAGLEDPQQAPSSASSETSSSLPFHWSQIESDDYREYIANLRAVGCPESTIRDLITADLAALYAPRAQAIWARQPEPYWRPGVQKGPTPEQIKALQGLEREQAGVMRELLGGGFSLQQGIDLLFFQLRGAEEDLLFLPESQRLAALDALGSSDLAQREQRLQQRGGHSASAADRLFDEKLALLAKVLSPTELEEYRLRASPRAQALRVELQYFACTPEEFGRILDLRRQDGDNAGAGNLLDRGAATAQIRELFGESRAQEFERVTDIHYQQARRSTDALGLPGEVADQAWEITREIRQTARAQAADPGLTLAERRTNIEALRQQADARLRTILGESGSRLLRRDLNVVLRGETGGDGP